VLFLGASPNKEEEEQGKVNLSWNFLDSARCKVKSLATWTRNLP